MFVDEIGTSLKLTTEASEQSRVGSDDALVFLEQNCLFSRPLQESNLRRLRCFLFVCLGLLKDDVRMIFWGILSHMGSLGQLKNTWGACELCSKRLSHRSFLNNLVRINLTYNFVKSTNSIIPHRTVALMEAYLKNHNIHFGFCVFRTKNVDFPQEVLGIPAVNVVNRLRQITPQTMALMPGSHTLHLGWWYGRGKTVIKHMYIPENERLEANTWWFVGRFFLPFFKGQTFFRFQPFVWRDGEDEGPDIFALGIPLKRIHGSPAPPPKKKGNTPEKEPRYPEWCVWKVGDSFYSKYGNFWY